jgi:hypothetical protein
MSVQSGYSELMEPLEQGGEIYVKCDECGRELLKDLGGWSRLPHKAGCPNAR